jgi:hypothetical protein
MEMKKELDPQQVIRERDGSAIFGFQRTVLKEKIDAGIIPRPKLLAPPPSRARGWFGWQIIEYRNQLEAAQAEWEAAAKKFYEARPKLGKRKKVGRKRK